MREQPNRCASFHEHQFAQVPWASCTTTQPSALQLPRLTPAQSPVWCCQVYWGRCRGAPTTDKVSKPHVSQPCNVWGHEQPLPSLLGAPLVPTQLLDPLLFPGSRKVKRHLVLYLSQTRLWGGRKQVISSYMTRASIQCLCSRVPTALATLVGDVDNYFK